jgi:hypothetical protein
MSHSLSCRFSQLMLAFVALGCSNAASGGGTSAGATGIGGAPNASAGASGGGASPTAGASDTLGGSVGIAGSGVAGSSGADVGGSSGANGGSAGAAQAGAAGAGGGTGCKGATVCYDFEECKTPAGWTVPVYPTDPGEGNQGAGSILVDNEKAHGGMCSLHMKDFSGDQPQHALLADLPANFGPVLWGRAWVFNTATPTNHGALIKLRYAIPNSSDVDWYEVGYEKQNYDGIWHSPLPPSGLPEWVLQSNTTIVVNAWTCVEWLFDTQNGTQPQAADPRIWQDGTEVTFKPGFEYDLNNPPPNTPRPTTPKGSNFIGMEVGLTMYHTIDEKTNIYLDDLALGAQRIGCN